jgi:hypothetical protein
MNKSILKGLVALGILSAMGPFALSSCSITAVRPSQEMSNMEVAIRAAKEVNADVLAPELYRLAAENGQNARREYRFKNFQDAKKLADKARVFAEKAEFESIRNGGKREALPQDPLADPSYAPEPVGTPIDGVAPSPSPGAPH